jgi:hypothetical protein
VAVGLAAWGFTIHTHTRTVLFREFHFPLSAAAAVAAVGSGRVRHRRRPSIIILNPAAAAGWPLITDYVLL